MTRIELYIPTRWSAWGDNIALSLPLYIFIYVNSTKILSYSVIWHMDGINNSNFFDYKCFVVFFNGTYFFLFVLGKLQSPISYDIHNQIFDIQYQNNEYFVKYHLLS